MSAAAVVVVPKCGSSRWELGPSSLPDDIALNIASLLDASDVCSLGSCSRLWRDVCASDVLWIALSRKRWPPSDSVSDRSESSHTQGWKHFYISEHKKLSYCASSIVKFVEQCSQNGSLEGGNYLKAMGDLCSTKLGFKDVLLFLLARKHGVLLNLIGLHYSILWLRIPASDVMEALHSCQVSERQVLVSWSKFGRWVYGFRMPDEYHSRQVSLGELAMANEDELPALEVLSVLSRGAIHEVLRVQISSATTSTAQPYQISDSES